MGVKITFFGLKSGKDLKNRAAHPHEEFSGVTPPPGDAQRPILFSPEWQTTVAKKKMKVKNPDTTMALTLSFNRLHAKKVNER